MLFVVIKLCTCPAYAKRKQAFVCMNCTGKVCAGNVRESVDYNVHANIVLLFFQYNAAAVNVHALNMFCARIACLYVIQFPCNL